MFEELNYQDYMDYSRGKQSNVNIRCFINSEREFLFDVEQYNNQLKENDILVSKIEKSFKQAKETGKTNAIYTEEAYQEAISLRDEAYNWLRENNLI